MSSIVLIALSPVWRAKLRSGLSEVNMGRLDLTPDDAASFTTVVQLGCGRSAAVHGGLAGLLDVGRLAAAYGIEHVHRAVEWEAGRRLTIETCAELLIGSSAAGMPRLAKTCRELARGELAALVQTEGFALLREEELRTLLDAVFPLPDASGRQEAAVFRLTAVLRSLLGARSRGGAMLGKRLCEDAQEQLSRTRARRPSLEPAEPTRCLTGEAESGGVEESGRSSEALRSWYAHDAAPREVLSSDLCTKSCLVVGNDLAAWGKYGGAVGCLLRHDFSDVAAANCSTSTVTAMTICGDWIAVGYRCGQIEIWERQGLRRLECICSLDCGIHQVNGLGSTGEICPRLVSQSKGVLQVWKAGDTPRTWVFEHSIMMHQVAIDGCFVVGGTVAATAHFDKTIQVWSLDSGSSLAILSGHKDAVSSLAIDTAGQLVVSASADRILRVWSVGTKTCLRQLDLAIDVRSLALSEGKVFGGLSSVVAIGALQTPAVHVWDLYTLGLEGTLWIEGRPVGNSFSIEHLIVDGGEVWAQPSLGNVLVWGWSSSRPNAILAGHSDSNIDAEQAAAQA